MDLATLARINEARAARRAVLLATNLASSAQILVDEEQAAPAYLAEACEKAFRQGKSGTVETPHGDTFLNVFVPPPRLLIIGAVHISQALYPMARAAGFDVTIIDPRTAFATPQRFPDVTLLPEWPDKVLPDIGIDRYTAIATLTHDPKVDDPALIAALRSKSFYVGALGSRKTHAKRVARLREAGFGEQDFVRIQAPIGLDIGAVSPAEIAVAVLAQVIAALRLPQEAS